MHWERVYPGYCKPVNIFRPIRVGSAKPKFRHSWLGFSHFTDDSAQANRGVFFMVLGGDDLRDFEVGKLRNKNRRNEVRKGLRLCSISRLRHLGPGLEEMWAVHKNQTLRLQRQQMSRGSADLGDAGFEKWRSEAELSRGLGNRTWWVARVEGRIVSYLVSYLIEDVMVIEKMKCHDRFFKKQPVAALYATVLCEAGANSDCRFVISGRPQHRSLDRYKETFLFKSRKFDYYSKRPMLVEMGKRVGAISSRMTNLVR